MGFDNIVTLFGSVTATEGLISILSAVAFTVLKVPEKCAWVSEGVRLCRVT